ncbi:MAG: hypothetical protein ACK4VO_00465 [Pseudobdellovibrio sp.]
MKKIGDIMKDMGFNQNAPDSAKEAFIKHLIRQSTGNDVVSPTEKKIIQNNPDKIIQFPQQMSFGFDDDQGPEITRQKSKIKQKY